jgi:hypothetical protein
MPISYLFDWGIPRHSVVHIEIAYIRISCYSVIDKVLHWVGLDSKTSGPVYFVVVLAFQFPIEKEEDITRLKRRNSLLRVYITQQYRK